MWGAEVEDFEEAVQVSMVHARFRQEKLLDNIQQSTSCIQTWIVLGRKSLSTDYNQETYQPHRDLNRVPKRPKNFLGRLDCSTREHL